MQYRIWKFTNKKSKKSYDWMIKQIIPDCYRSGWEAEKRNDGWRITFDTEKYCGGISWNRGSSISCAPMITFNCLIGALLI